MRPLRWISSALLVSGCLCASWSCGGSEEADGGLPTGPALGRSVLLITLDTTRADRVGCYGHAEARTPTIDALAEAGVRFDRAYAQVPLTLPSHASLLTGTYPLSNGVRTNGAGGLNESVPTLAERLRARQLRTGAFLASWVLDSSFGLDRGFDRYDDDLPTDRFGADVSASRDGAAVTDAALAWLAEEPERDFFLWVHYFDPHHPYEVPKAEGDWPTDPYDAELAFVDAQVARLLAWLDAHGRRERTLVAIVGDHGEAFGYRGEDEHGLLLYDCAIRVPLVFADPDDLPAGRVVEEPVALVDVAPTLLALLDVEVPARMQGESLLPAIRGEGLGDRPVYSETEYGRLSFGWASLASLSDERWRYIEAPTPELYDLLADGEERNVAGEHPDVLAAYKTRLAELRAGMPERAPVAIAQSAAALARLEALGYAGGGAEPGDGPLRNPVEMIPLHNDFKRAKQLATRGQYEEARVLLEAITRESPESGEFVGVLAYAYLRLGRLEEAREAFQRSMRTMPDNPWKWCGLGDALMGLGEQEDAQLAYERALEIDPDCGQAHTRLGIALAEQGDFSGAAFHHRRNLELYPESPAALVSLAGVLTPLGQSGEALSLLQRSVALDPDYGETHRSRWQILDHLGRRAEANAALREAVRTLPGDSDLALTLAWRLATSKVESERDGGAALGYVEPWFRRNPSSIRACDVLAAARAEVGDYVGALDAAERAVRLADEAGRPALAQQLELHARAYAERRPWRE